MSRESEREFEAAGNCKESGDEVEWEGKKTRQAPRGVMAMMMIMMITVVMYGTWDGKGVLWLKMGARGLFTSLWLALVGTPRQDRETT